MKKIIFILSIIWINFGISILSIHAQNFEPIHDTLLIGGVPYLFSADSSYFLQNSFILGWHWSRNKPISKALLMNQAHTSYNNPSCDDSTDLIDTVNIIVQPNGVSCNAQATTAMQSQAIQYEPTLFIHPDSVGLFKTRENDTTNPVIGFQTWRFMRTVNLRIKIMELCFIK